MEKITLFTSDIAFRACLMQLERRGYFIERIVPINNNRYLIVKGTENIMITFKRDVFRNFGRMFDGKSKTVGDSINVEDLKKAITYEVKTIYLILKDGNVYSIPLQDFLCKSVKWTNMENKEIRSVSIHEYRKEFKL